MSETEQSQAVAEGQSGASPEAQIVVSKVVNLPVEHVWGAFNTKPGVEALLGSGAVLGGKGDSWHTAEGPHGVLRSYHAMEQIRVSWHASEDAPKTLVDIHLRPLGDQTEVTLEHLHIDEQESGTLTDYWNQALDRFATTVK